MKNKFLILYILVFSLFCSACSAKENILELEDVGNLEVSYYSENEKGFLRICGLCTHSALAVKKINYSQNKNSMLVKIKLGLMIKENESGSFDFSIPIPDDADTVFFGNNKKEIWQREHFNFISDDLEIKVNTKSVNEKNSHELRIRAKVSIENISEKSKNFNLENLKVCVKNQTVDDSQKVYIDSISSVLVQPQEIPSGKTYTQNVYWVLKTNSDSISVQDIFYDYLENSNMIIGAADRANSIYVSQNAAYSFINPNGNTISTRFNPPAGFTRVQANGFGEFLRSYPLLQDGSPVLLYDGSKKWNQRTHVAVFDMKLVRGDLQQCADSCMRLYAEYFYKAKRYEKIAFHLVNGFLVDFETWRKGGRVSVKGNKTEWVMNASPSDSQETFEKYLVFVFAYASTLSMEKESKKIDVKEIRAGDFFIQGGSPGHVVMVLDVCQNERGEKAFLLGQGYMPAQQFHVLKNPLHENDPWYYESELQFPLATPEYTFGEGSLKRPIYGN